MESCTSPLASRKHCTTLSKMKAASTTAHNPDLCIIAHLIAVPQIVITLEQKPEQPALRTAGGDRFHAQGAERLQPSIQDTGIMRTFGPAAVAPAIDRRPLSGWQPNQPSSFQLEQQAPTSHVLNPTRFVAPSPELTQIPGQSGPMPRRVLPQQGLDLGQLLPAQIPALDDGLAQHLPLGYTKPASESRAK